MTSLEERITLTAKSFSNINDVDGQQQDKVNHEVEIIFEEKCQPRTDGKKIYLPIDMNEERLWELLGTLLHECMHVRFTEMKSIRGSFYNDTNLFHVLNTLEDMRINYKAMQIFPKSKLFFHALYYYLAKNNKDVFLGEPIAFQVLKTFILENDDFPTFSKDAIKIIDEKNLWRFRDIARHASSVAELQEPAKELYEILKSLSKEQLGNFSSPELDEFLKKISKKMNEDNNSVSDEHKEKREKLNKLHKKLDELLRESKNLHRKEATNKTRARNLNNDSLCFENDAKTATENGDKKEAQRLQELSDHKEKLSTAASFREAEAGIKLSDVEQQIQELRKQIDSLGDKVDKLAAKMAEIQEQTDDFLENGAESNSAAFGYSPLSLNGVESLKSEDLVYENSYVFPKSLEDTIREIFLKKKEETEVEDEGKRLNRKNLYRIATDNQRLFETTTTPYDKTKVSFLLDASGSMGGERAKAVNTAFAYLYNSLNEVLVSEQLDVQIGVYSFDNYLYKLKGFEEVKSGDKIIAGYKPRGGTEILKNLQKVISEIQETGENEKKVIILLTDAEVYEAELLKIKNSINFEDIKVVFLGVEMRDWYGNNSNIAKSLFMDNIKIKGNIVEVLTKALVRTL